MKEIRERYVPRNGRKLRAFVLNGIVCFQSWLSKLERSLRGLTIEKDAKDVAHCIRFVQRRDLEFYKGNDAWAVEQDLWRKNGGCQVKHVQK